MKKLVSIAVLSFLVVSGAALAQQSGDQEKGSSMHGMMGQMMQGEKGKEGMGSMMRMMKMMDQCASMMESSDAKAEKPQEGQQK